MPETYKRIEKEGHETIEERENAESRERKGVSSSRDWKGAGQI
jgi:hypothetical protein